MTKETVLFYIITASESFFFAVNIHGLLPSFECLFLRGGDGGLILLGQFVSPLPSSQLFWLCNGSSDY